MLLVLKGTGRGPSGMNGCVNWLGTPQRRQRWSLLLVDEVKWDQMNRGVRVCHGRTDLALTFGKKA